MKKISVIAVTLVGAAVLWASPISLHQSQDKGWTLSVDKARARIGRPLTPGSIAGVHRRVERRGYRRGYYSGGYGHYGYGYQLGLRAIEQTKDVTRLSAKNPANQPFFDAAIGLVRCLVKMGKRGLVQDVVKRLIQLDPTDPLELRSMLKGSR